jgi:hypothetical protein
MGLPIGRHADINEVAHRRSRRPKSEAIFSLADAVDFGRKIAS